jgi:Mrp family chromosome partitioning ATPase
VTEVASHKGWDLLTAGREPPDPPRLLSSKRMRQLLEDIVNRGGYDLVIVDTPPALGLSDASLVAEHVDGLLMVVSLRRVPRDMPAIAIRRIREAGAPVLGIITNSRQLRRDTQVTVDYDLGKYQYNNYDSNGSNERIYGNDPLMAYSYYEENAKTYIARKGSNDGTLSKSRGTKGKLRLVRRKISAWFNE